MAEWTVLLVDDEPEFVTTLAERLSLRGMQVKAVTDGEAALRAIAASPPRVVVLDLMMPGLGGQEVLQRIKQQYPEIQVILLTGQGSTRDSIQGMQAGAFDYLMKPLKIEELVAKIGEAVQSGP